MHDRCNIWNRGSKLVQSISSSVECLFQSVLCTFLYIFLAHCTCSAVYYADCAFTSNIWQFVLVDFCQAHTFETINFLNLPVSNAWTSLPRNNLWHFLCFDMMTEKKRNIILILKSTATIRSSKKERHIIQGLTNKKTNKLILHMLIHFS